VEEILGDVNGDGIDDFDDIPAFIAVLQSGVYEESADINEDGAVNFDDIPDFVTLLMGQ
jgi:hypothetical protein